MSKSQATRTRENARVTRQLTKPVLPDDIKIDVANVVQNFDFVDMMAGGYCALWAMLGQAALRACGLKPRLTSGAMLYRAGHHPIRDTMSFCLPNNRGGFHQGLFIGHVWNEVNDEIIDFSPTDWERVSQSIYETETNPIEIELGPVAWIAEPPWFVWQSAGPLKRAWRSSGEPDLGELWYGEWPKDLPIPDHSGFNPIVAQALPYINERIADLKLRERIKQAMARSPI